MSTISDAVNISEAVAIALGIYLLYKLYGTAKDALTQAGATAEVTGVADWVATTKPLTAAHADSLAKFIGVDLHGGGWNLSPDATQIWFFDGSFFDNKNGHFFDANGADRGDLLGNAGASGTPLDSFDSLDQPVNWG